MKFTLSWLKDYLETDASVEEIAEKLTSIGLEVESIDKREALSAFIIAKVTAAEKHPNADKLQILRVDTGASRPLQVVCGAPNARVGLVGVFAPPGAYVPGLDMVLSVGKIRDVESFGMMCSERELLLSEEHDGIIDLGEEVLRHGQAEIGQSFAAYKGLDDPIFDVGLTPNRADCASVYGIARDLAAAGLGKFKTPYKQESLSSAQDSLSSAQESLLLIGDSLKSSPVAESIAENPAATVSLGTSTKESSLPVVHWGNYRNLLAPFLLNLEKQRVSEASIEQQLSSAADKKGRQSQPVALRVKIEDKKNCLGFSMLRIENIENRASPSWIQNRLRAVGLSPKNALVDISNYLTFDIGQPLHIFDADKMRGALHIRRARKGEKFEALNGKTYALCPDYCVIADDSGVISLPGIMGGISTACEQNTKAVLVESALWNPLIIARMGRDLGIISDARYRFERGVDPVFMLPALVLAAEQIKALCGSVKTHFSPETIEAVQPWSKREISFPLKEIQRLTGIDVPQKKVEALLAALGFGIEPSGQEADGAAVLRVCVPTWRADIHGKADLVEEVIRLHGVDKIKPLPLPHEYCANGDFLTQLQSRSRLVRRHLACRSMAEAVTYSFISAAAANLFGGGQAELKLANPIAADMSDMRPSLLPNLLAAAKRNADRGYSDVALFEVGDVYLSTTADGQKRMAAGIRAGTAEAMGKGRMWNGHAPAVDCFSAKADALAVLEALGVAADKVQVERGAPSYFHPGRSGVIKLGPKNILGYFGELHPETAVFFGLRGVVCAFELFLTALPESRKKAIKTKPALALSLFQPVRRDFSFIVDAKSPASVALRAARNADKKHIAHVQLFDVFTGTGIEPGKKALGLEVIIQPWTHSLTDEELEAVSQKLITSVLKATKGVLRCV